METIVVQWFVHSGREGEMERPELSPETTPGFISERLFRADDEADGVTRFVNVGQWETRDAFYARFPLARPGQPLRIESYEAQPRIRGWLEPIPTEPPA
jgi:heme-degrading monooxygenase HmoA